MRYLAEEGRKKYIIYNIIKTSIIKIKNYILVSYNLFLVFLVPLLLFACASHEKYPEQWSKPVEPQKACEDISGTYSNVGDSAYYYLSSIIKNIDPDQIFKATHVVIYYPASDIITITAWNENIPIGAKTFRKDDFKCTEKGIEVSLGYESDYSGLVGTFVRGKATITKTEDGYLLVITEGSALYIVGPGVPFAGTGLSYSRFPPKKVMESAEDN